MNALVDTHVVLWWLNNDEKLTESHRKIITSDDSVCYVSAATIWEISIKQMLGKLTVPPGYLDELTREGFIELAISWEHARAVLSLPPIHRDPFDRLLVAQAQAEALTLLCVDENIRKYDVSVA